MTLRLEETEGVVVLTLDRPPVNALDLDTVLALEDRFKALAESPPAALVLTGEGHAFCAGVDTRAFAAAPPKIGRGRCWPSAGWCRRSTPCRRRRSQPSTAML